LDCVPTRGGGFVKSRWPNSMKRSGLTSEPQRQMSLFNPWKSQWVCHPSKDTWDWVISSLTRMQVMSVLEVRCHKYRKASNRLTSLLQHDPI
jgi:hypothetical protein